MPGDALPLYLVIRALSNKTPLIPLGRTSAHAVLSVVLPGDVSHWGWRTKLAGADDVLLYVIAYVR
jgi:hypothetical protein